ncbi:glucoamylase family protein [Lysobacter sp. A289]
MTVSPVSPPGAIESRRGGAGRLVAALLCSLLLFACKPAEPPKTSVEARQEQIQQAQQVQVTPPAEPVVEAVPEKPVLPELFDDIERRTFQFFWDTTNERNGLTPDRYPSRPFSSVAAIGFALTAYPIGIENGWISRTQALDRTLTTLKFLRDIPSGKEATGNGAWHGFFYHFLDIDSGERYSSWVELSSVDTGLLMMGVLFAQSYYQGDDPRAVEIREIADELYRRVEWTWLQRNPPLISMGWYPESGFIEYDWKGYDEAMLLYVLALGSPTHPVEPEAWTVWTRTYNEVWGVYQGEEYLSFGPLFGHQFSHVWIDFRGIRDEYMRERGIDYFENSRRAAYAHRAYAIANPMGWKGYGENVWGLTASDGPQNTLQEYAGEQRQFHHYTARGAGLSINFDDGTIAPTAAIASLPFAPEIVIPATVEMHKRYGDFLYSSYGFLDAFNPSFNYEIPLKNGRIVPGKGWVSSDYIGIDQGPILTMIANYRNDFVWDVMKRNKYIRAGLERAGFTGGWLAPEPEPEEGQAQGQGRNPADAPAPADPEAAAARAMGQAEARSRRPPAEPAPVPLPVP